MQILNPRWLRGAVGLKQASAGRPAHDVYTHHGGSMQPIGMEETIHVGRLIVFFVDQIQRLINFLSSNIQSY